MSGGQVFWRKAGPFNLELRLRASAFDCIHGAQRKTGYSGLLFQSIVLQDSNTA